MGEERVKITLSSPGLNVVVGEQANARRGVIQRASARVPAAPLHCPRPYYE